MNKRLAKTFKAAADSVFAAMTPRQRALLARGKRVHVRLGNTRYTIVPAEAIPASEVEIPVRIEPTWRLPIR